MVPVFRRDLADYWLYFFGRLGSFSRPGRIIRPTSCGGFSHGRPVLLLDLFVACHARQAAIHRAESECVALSDLRSHFHRHGRGRFGNDGKGLWILSIAVGVVASEIIERPFLVLRKKWFPESSNSARSAVPNAISLESEVVRAN